MVQEAEQYKAEDEVQREKISAKNSLESLAFNMKSTAEDEKLKDKLSPEDKQKILDKCNEVISWLDRNQVSESVFRQGGGWEAVMEGGRHTGWKGSKHREGKATVVAYLSKGGGGAAG